MIIKKAIKKSIVALLFVAFLIFIWNQPSLKVKRILKVNSSIKDVHICKYNFSIYYRCPRAIYIRFNSDSTTLSKLIKKYNLKQYYNRSIYDIDWNIHNNISEYYDFEYKLKWWIPNDNNIKNRYMGKIYYGHSINRITLQVDNNYDFFIIIECI